MPPRRAPQQSPAEAAYSAAVKAVEARTGRSMILFSKPALEKMDVADIKPDWLVSTRPHVLILPAVEKVRSKHVNELLSTPYNWPGGGTSLGGELWSMLMERLETVDTYLEKQKWPQAFGERCQWALLALPPQLTVTLPLLGLLLAQMLFALRWDTHWNDHEEDSAVLREYVESSSKQWSDLLSRSDAELGLASVPGGLPGGYRAPLLRMLGRYQRTMNKTLAQVGYMFAEDEEGTPRFTILPEDGEPEEGEESDDDDEEEEEE